MMTPEISNSKLKDTLSYRLENWSQRRNTGVLVIHSGGDLRWQLYFFMGRLSWASGGRYHYRRWQRLLQQYCPEWHQKFQESQSPDDYCEMGHEYRLLTSWINQHKITGEQASSLSRGLVAEILFDILQCEETRQVSYQDQFDQTLSSFLTLLNPELLMHQANFTWKKWKTAGLTQLSPDLAPKVSQPEALKATLPPTIYQKLDKVLNGNQSLRDVAIALQQDLVVLIRTLAPYLRNKQITLVKISDITPPLCPIPLHQRNQLNSEPTIAAPDLLVIGIDDSYLEKQILERYVRRFRCRFIGIEDPIQALPLLLEHQPDLIFLDLVMPIANGYEICAQIRKITKLKDTPVVILTGNDGIVDRVRAKLVGATDFLGKPIDEKQVEQMLQRYLPHFSRLQQQSLSPQL